MGPRLKCLLFSLQVGPWLQWSLFHVQAVLWCHWSHLQVLAGLRLSLQWLDSFWRPLPCTRHIIVAVSWCGLGPLPPHIDTGFWPPHQGFYVYLSLCKFFLHDACRPCYRLKLEHTCRNYLRDMWVPNASHAWNRSFFGVVNSCPSGAQGSLAILLQWQNPLSFLLGSLSYKPALLLSCRLSYIFMMFLINIIVVGYLIIPLNFSDCQ